MSKNYTSQRLKAFKQQKCRCYYCGIPMWLKHVGDFAKKYNLTERQARRIQCTAEHVVARQDGGNDSQKNIVAACHFCNQSRHRRRHPLSAKKYRSYVSQRMKKLKWHPEKYHSIQAESQTFPN